MAPMTSAATWLVDTSALARLAMPEVGEVMRPLIDAGRVAVAAVTLLEIGYTARSKGDHERSQQSVLQRLQFVYASPRSERRALEVQQRLMERGHHRSVKLPDLLVAAVAETEGLTVMHYDADFDRISDITGQPSTWVVEAGTIT
jgi:predicted nucleic acid-binding protein